MITKKPCKYCNKVSDLTSEIDLGNSGKWMVFACGHSYIEPVLEAVKVSENAVEKTVFQLLQEQSENPPFCDIHKQHCVTAISSGSGKHLFPYQAKGIIAAVKANANFIFADEMGLGKTVQGLGVLKVDPNLLPAFFVCKSIAKMNMLWEVMDWLEIPAQIIYSSSDTPFESFKVHIMSHDMVNKLNKKYDISKASLVTIEDLRRKEELEKLEKEFGTTESEVALAMLDKESNGNGNGNGEKEEPIVKLGQKQKVAFLKNKNAWEVVVKRCQTIIIDECHLIKNPETQRTKAVRGLAAQIPHKIPMSGTLTKNNATEYFVPLNIIKPEKYWRYSSFCYNHVRVEYVRTVTGNSSPKFTGLLDPIGFKRMTQDYMIRRTTDEVLPDLPKLFKKQEFVELDKDFKAAYEKSEKAFIEWFEQANAAELRTNLLAQLALLRHQTSLAKVDYTLDLALEFLLSCDRKIAIFTHHIDAREYLASRMIEFFNGYYKEIGEDTKGEDVVHVLTQGKDVQEEIAQFQNSPKARIIILSTLSHGESINLQFMSDCILHERQWNPANEDQAVSGRFRRIGQESKSIQCMIPVALGTIDEYFVELVDRKRANTTEYDTGVVNEWAGVGSFAGELADMISQRGRAKWRL